MDFMEQVSKNTPPISYKHEPMVANQDDYINDLITH